MKNIAIGVILIGMASGLSASCLEPQNHHLYEVSGSNPLKFSPHSMSASEESIGLMDEMNLYKCTVPDKEVSGSGRIERENGYRSVAAPSSLGVVNDLSRPTRPSGEAPQFSLSEPVGVAGLRGKAEELLRKVSDDGDVRIELIGEVPNDLGYYPVQITNSRNQRTKVWLAGDGRYFISGGIYDDTGEPIPMMFGGMGRILTDDGVYYASVDTNGRAQPDRAIYLFVDPGCPHCQQLYREIRQNLSSILSSGGSLYWIPVAVVSRPEQAAAMFEMARSGESLMQQGMTTDERAIQAVIENTARLNERIGRGATPVLAWRTEGGHGEQYQVGFMSAGDLRSLLVTLMDRASP